jgi:copper(I)-binding protein
MGHDLFSWIRIGTHGDQMTRTIFIAAAMFAAGLISVLAAPAQAEDTIIGSLKISAPWARATPKGASVGGGYMKITNTGGVVDHLIGGTSGISSGLEVHEMSIDNGVMKMRPLASGVEIKPGQTVELNPSGYHLMFVGLKQQLMQGHNFIATLEFAKAGKIDVEFKVESIGARTGGDDHVMPGVQMNH